VPVRWEVATDDGFRDVVRRGTAVARPEWGHSVHVDVGRLHPGRWYFYRFRVRDQLSPVGRTRTAPARGATGDRLRFLFGSCQNWQSGCWPLWAHAPADDPDLVLHLGDYIYEGPAGTGPSIVRPHNGPEIVTLDDYRNRYGLYKGDPALQGIHAACPWVVTWDDHEVENNYAGLTPQVVAEAPAFPARRAAAYQAWWEHMAVRLPAPTGPDLAIYRSLDWGRLARFHVLDTRQYRSDQPCGDGTGPTAPSAPTRPGPCSAPTRRRGSARAWRRPGPPGTCWPTRSS
jgi:alkaline phosphatase D